MGAFGAVLEFGMIRPLKSLSPTYMALVTFGLALILEQLILRIFGGGSYSPPPPDILRGSVELLGTQYPTYRIFVIGVGLVFSTLLFLWLRYTRTGLFVRAVSQDPQTSEMLGVNKDRVGLLVVCLATASAGLAGVLAGPYVTVYPAMGSTMVIIALIIVVIGGVGSLGGAFAVAVAYGFVQVFGSQWAPGFAAVVPYLVAFVVLIFRPNGFGRSREV
jgi:branched-chain amino acid transport system permease protein